MVMQEIIFVFQMEKLWIEDAILHGFLKSCSFFQNTKQYYIYDLKQKVNCKPTFILNFENSTYYFYFIINVVHFTLFHTNTYLFTI